MPKMPSSEVLAMLQAERADSLSAKVASKLSAERTKAMDYYLGNMTDLSAPEGQSKAVSNDVADTVDGLLPPLMEIFAGDEVVRFEPVGAEDVKAAQQETDYVNHVFMQRNPGFMLLYGGFKDALISKTGIWKPYWDTGEEVEEETYYDLTDAQYQMLLLDPEVEIVEHTERSGDVVAGVADSDGGGSDLADSPALEGGNANPLMPSAGNGVADGLGVLAAPATHDVKIRTKRNYECAKVALVAPEDFGISRYATADRDTWGCVWHDVPRRVGEMIAEGYDAEQLAKVPTYIGRDNTEQVARNTVNESSGAYGGASNDANSTSRLIKVTEYHVRMAYEGKDDPGLYRIETAADESIILKKNGEDVIVREDVMPFAVITPFPQTHRFFGRSVADVVMETQRIQTVLMRQFLTNQYQHNNPRPVVPEAAGPEALDDLQLTRPAEPIRVKTNQDPIVWTQVPDITGSFLPAAQFFDTKRTWRTGVDRQGQGVDSQSLQNQVATIANQMEDAAAAKVKLMARIFAETGVKDLFMLLHGIIRKNSTRAQTIRLRNEWVEIDPRDWKKREDMTINVGLGTGSKAQQLAGQQLLIGAQTQAVQIGMVSPRNFWNSAAQLCKILGHKDPDEFFTKPGAQVDPNDPASAPLKPPGNPKAAQGQQKIALDAQKVQADVALQRQKNQSDVAAAQQKAQAEYDLRMRQLRAEAALKLEQMNREFALEVEQMEREHELRRQEIALNAHVRESVGHAQARAKSVGGVRFGGEVG